MEFVQGGNRRIDRILDPAFVVEPQKLSLEDLRERRNLARQEESDLSYVRRMLQGRLEILEAEKAMASDQGRGDLVSRLTDLLASPAGSSPGSSRITQEPTNLSEERRSAERLVGDAGLRDRAEMAPEDFEALIERLRREERSVSDFRTRVQAVIQVFTVELGARYKAGTASPLL